MATKEDFAKIVKKHYPILQQLYHESELSISQISENLKVDRGNTSRNIAELENEGLIKTHEGLNIPRVTRSGQLVAGGKPRKLCSLTSRTWRIMQLYEAEPIKAPTNELVEELLTLVEDKNRTINFRTLVAGKLSDLAIEQPDALIENQRIKSLFMEILSGNSSLDEKVSRIILSAMTTLLVQRISTKNVKTWFDRQIKEVLFTKVSDEKDQGINDWATDTLVRAARSSKDQELVEKTIDKLVEVYFKTGINSKVAKSNLLTFEQKYQKKILEKITAYAKAPAKSLLAEELLTTLISTWIPNSFLNDSNNQTVHS
jgi:DNA-binding transcriptional ArsR family regulator